MSDALPSGWAKVILDDVVDVRDFEREPINSLERAGRLEGKSKAELFPYYGATGQVGWIDDYRSEGEQVLLGEDGAPFLDQHRDKAYIVNGRYWVNNHAHVLRGVEGAMRNRFLVHQLNLTDYHEFVTGSTRLKLTSAAMRKIPLLVPPHAEQARIVEKLEELLSDLDAGVAELKIAQRKLAQYRQSLLKAAVEGALTADWRAAHGKPQESGAELLQRILSERRARWERKQLARFAEQGKAPPKGWQAKYPEPVAPNLSDLPPLPEGWTWATVDQCAIDENGITDGPFGSNLKSEHYTESGPRVIRLQNIGDGRFQDARANISEERYESLRKHAVIEGDVVVAMLGEVLPRACAVPAGIAPAIVKADCARVRLNPDLVPPEVVVAALNSEPIRKRVNGLVKGIGRPRVNLGSIRSIPLPLPSRAEQRQILSLLSESLEACDDQSSAIEKGFSLSAAQLKNILKAAFAGQLVPQDPNDEPAGELLARIRAARLARTVHSRK